MITAQNPIVPVIRQREEIAYAAIIVQQGILSAIAILRLLRPLNRVEHLKLLQNPVGRSFNSRSKRDSTTLRRARLEITIPAPSVSGNSRMFGFRNQKTYLMAKYGHRAIVPALQLLPRGPRARSRYERMLMSLLKRARLAILSVAFVGTALAANPQDEQIVRNAYAVQSHTVFVEATKNPNLKSPELAQKLQDNELRFEITEMSSGALSDIVS